MQLTNRRLQGYAAFSSLFWYTRLHIHLNNELDSPWSHRQFLAHGPMRFGHDEIRPVTQSANGVLFAWVKASKTSKFRLDHGIPSHQLTWKCKKALSKRKVVFLQGFVNFHVSWWESNAIYFHAVHPMLHADNADFYSHASPNSGHRNQSRAKGSRQC